LIKSLEVERKSLEDKAKEMEQLIQQEEKNYKAEIAKQIEKTRLVNEEIAKLSLKLKEKEQEIRINEIKLKEIKRISKNSMENRAASANLPIKKQGDKNAVSIASSNKKPFQINKKFDEKESASKVLIQTS
jgi:hypothetical protein